MLASYAAVVCFAAALDTPVAGDDYTRMERVLQLPFVIGFSLVFQMGSSCRFLLFLVKFVCRWCFVALLERAAPPMSDFLEGGECNVRVNRLEFSSY